MRKCGICGKLTPGEMKTPICQEDIPLMHDAFVTAVHAARKKKAEQEGQGQEVEVPSSPTEPTEEPIPIPVEPPHDKYQIKKLYQSDLSSGQVIVHYMDMDNPSKDPLFRNEEGEGLEKGQFGGYRSQGGSNGQLRLELWDNDGIRDMEGTVYSKFIKVANTGKAGSYLFQVYRGGGSHSSKYFEGQEGACYKGRIRKDRSVVIVKEVRHPDYTSNEGNIKKLKKDPMEIFLGVKLVVYNLKPLSNGRVPVKIEVWCDEEGMDEKGNFDPKKQNWQKYAEYVDKGGWKAGDGGGNPAVEIGNNGERKGDEILNTTKGAVRNKGNLFAYRTDHVITEIKFLGWRKIKNPVGGAS